MSKKVLVATEKPFAPEAVTKIREIVEKAGYRLELLEKYTEKSALLKAVADADALIIRSDKADGEVLDASGQLKIVVRAGAGYDNIDCAKAKEKGIVAMNTPGQNSNAVAELVFAMMLYRARNFFTPKAGTELRGKTIGIHAYGNVGHYVAQIAKGFGMKILAFDPFVKRELMEKNGVTSVASVEELYEKADYVSLHLPKMKETLGFVNEALLKKMKRGAALVNTARKEVVDEDALQKVLAQRTDLSYLSDIAPDCAEALSAACPGRVYFTPKKMGAQTNEANVNAGVAAANQIVAFFEKGDTTYQVNK
jgi:D-3-phosphoglycerate dehydrogenase